MAWEPAVERRQRGGGHRIGGSPSGPGGAAAVALGGLAGPQRGAIAEDRSELLVDLAGDIALEAADDLALGLAFGGAPGHIAAGARITRHAHQHDAPQGVVGLTVPAAVQAVADGAARGRRQRRGATQHREGSLAPEPLGLSPATTSSAPATSAPTT